MFRLLIFQVFAVPDGALIIAKCDMFAGLFIVVAAIAGITMCLQSASFTSAGLIMTNRLRGQYFSSLLRQVTRLLLITTRDGSITNKFVIFDIFDTFKYIFDTYSYRK